MIDEALDIEFAAHLRITLDEMIPKLVAHATLADAHHVDAGEVLVRASTSPTPRPRRFAAALLAVAATVLGLIVITRRDDAVPRTPASHSTDAEIPAWYAAIRPALPARFTSVALTLATEQQLWFVATSPADGKALEIQLAVGGYSTETSTAVDAAGTWTETAEGWSVRTAGGLFIDVRCDIGVISHDPAGRPNDCDLPSTVPFTKAEVREVARTLATLLTPSLFESSIDPPQPEAIDTASATALIAAALPEQHLLSDTDWGQHGSDHVYEFGADPNQSATSVRILHGVYPPPGPTDKAAWALYDVAAAFWVFGAGGVAVRMSTTNTSAESLARLEALAHDLLGLGPSVQSLSPEASPAATEPVADATTTIAPAVT